MPICAMLGCSNSTYHLYKWKYDVCDSHHCKVATGNCFCPPPFKLFPFPTERRDGAARLRWAKLVNRKNQKGTHWLPHPNGYSRVCSKHFVDGEPTELNPDPVLNLGYLLLDSPMSPRALPRRDETPSNKRRKSVTATQTNVDQHVDDGPDNKRLRAFALDHAYVYKCSCQENCNCTGCIQKQKDINKLTDKVEMLVGKVEELKLKLKNASIKKRFCSNINDKNVRRLTGLFSTEDLDNLCEYLKPKAMKMRYCEGKKKVVSTIVPRNFKRTPKKTGPKSKLSVKDEMILVLMKLRLGLSMVFLASLFGLSVGTCSKIFYTWIKFLAIQLKPLIFWPNRDLIRSTQPKQIINKWPALRCILDCAEIFIERPQHLQLQALTWSEHKKHNTVKLLVGIAPNGMITFLSNAWGGRSSDAHIVRKSEFLNLVDPGDCIMADREFPIQEDLKFRQAYLEILPPSDGYQPMTTEKVHTTKKVANVRIHVERAIGRLKYFNILGNTLPITLVPHIDDIFTVCAALCNLLPPLVCK
ncbi:uncharacterized protein LOC129704819 [Leucoraja erinacea]|uniref:uncharacterized protein LOC129704819 n=1 Tax=Leucoraja erinaceus TaxID=7782 RepID=UPI002455AF0F|nr:uncharacterized protein LOC129704819 [Leucoraja erinacea]XP_055504153.1 uncharacterized protein LOC129704819 [Leucoraja erinacea]XP_055504154.1 uncharacterized protein LOC129704819 [Leucoraja erinacea]XP_055504155.1 uncharacterized protein LOC129704819 [Leucoraja erinacea]XP_055504156.1 uncharacterized protein LOC129704819 [Leucoraja erinacea]XP_055504157.1 uncharacterized protein LOC129704819 [Leucoraja erinacea]